MVLFLVGIFYQLISIEGTDFTYNQTLSLGNVTGNQTLDESTSEYTKEVDAGVFDINMTTGFIALIVGLVIVGTVAGIRILGSGLSDFSVKIIYNATTYYGIWAIFSVISIGFFLAIPIFGTICWFALTVFYSLGFFQTLHGE